MTTHRLERVSELVKQQVSEIIQEFTLTDCGFITVTGAEVSPDLKEGRIFISVIGPEEQRRRALHTLTAQHGHIQHELAHRIILKYTPHLAFVLDDTEARAERIDHLLDELGEPSSHE